MFFLASKTLGVLTAPHYLALTHEAVGVSLLSGFRIQQSSMFT